MSSFSGVTEGEIPLRIGQNLSRKAMGFLCVLKMIACAKVDLM